jgi:hypothetical protein
MASLDIVQPSGWLALALIPLCWIVRRPRGAAVVVAADGVGIPSAAAFSQIG